jgi:acyl carrier protein
MTEIAKSLRQFISENFLFGVDDRYSDDDSFLENGIIDSTGVLELIAFLEKTFAMTVEDEELVPENLDSVNNVVRFVETKRKSAQQELLEATS